MFIREQYLGRLASRLSNAIIATSKTISCEDYCFITSIESFQISASLPHPHITIRIIESPSEVTSGKWPANKWLLEDVFGVLCVSSVYII